MATIEKVPHQPFELSIKRLSAPYVVKGSCENCGELFEVDFSCDEYLSYPDIGTENEIPVDCEECGCENTFNVKIDISMELM